MTISITWGTLKIPVLFTNQSYIYLLNSIAFLHFEQCLFTIKDNSQEKDKCTILHLNNEDMLKYYTDVHTTD